MIGYYERVSSVGQNLDGQHGELESHAKRQEALGAETAWFTDKMTGKTMARPGFEALLADVRSGKVTSVVVWRLDRLGRTASGLLTLLDELQALKCNFVSMREGIDLATPAGRLMVVVLAGISAYESEVRAERQAVGIAAAHADGRRWGGRKPGTMQKRTAELDAHVRDLKAQGKPVAQIARLVKLSRPIVYAILAPEAH